MSCSKSKCSTAQRIASNISSPFSDIQERLRKVVIEHLDFEQLIHTYDRPGAFFYCDPPYMGTERYYQHPFAPADHERLARVLHGIKGRYLVSYNDCAEVRSLYRDCTIQPVTRHNSLPGVPGKDPIYNEVLIRNY